VFEPETRRYEYILNKTVVATYGVKFTKLRASRPRTTDLGAEAQAYAMLAAFGGVTPNDARDLLGKSRFDSAFGNTPFTHFKEGFLEVREKEDGMVTDIYKAPPPPDEGEGAGAGGAASPAQKRVFKLSTRNKVSDEIAQEVHTLARALESLGFEVAITGLDTDSSGQ
jgi:hypothetical protein